MQYIIISLTEHLANSGLDMKRTIEEFHLVFIKEKLILISICMPVIAEEWWKDDLSPSRKIKKIEIQIFHSEKASCKSWWNADMQHRYKGWENTVEEIIIWAFYGEKKSDRTLNRYSVYLKKQVINA